jgi:hypothetical protein
VLRPRRHYPCQYDGHADVIPVYTAAAPISSLSARRPRPLLPGLHCGSASCTLVKSVDAWEFVSTVTRSQLCSGGRSAVHYIATRADEGGSGAWASTRTCTESKE